MSVKEIATLINESGVSLQQLQDNKVCASRCKLCVPFIEENIELIKYGQTDPYAYYDKELNRHVFLDEKELKKFLAIENTKSVLKNRK
jgi:bacterioferritin-associated ferredoxin